MKSASRFGGDILLSLVCITFAGVLYYAALDVPPPFFDPLGSAAVPKGCAIIIVFLSLILLVRAVVLRSRSMVRSDPISEKPEAVFRPRPDLAAGFVGLTIACVSVMSFGWLGFNWAICLYIFCCGILLGGRSKSVILISIVLGVVMGFGGQYLFTEVLFIDLPVG